MLIDPSLPSYGTGTVQRAAGASTPRARGTTKVSSPSSNAAAKRSPHIRYQHGLKHHPRPQPGTRPAEPNSKPSKLPSSAGPAAASTPSTTAIDDKQHRQALSSLREWLPPENPPDSVDTGEDAEGEQADGVEEDVLGDALDDELVAKVYGAAAPPHRGFGLSITDMIGTLFTGHHSQSESHSFMEGVRNVMHMPKRAEVRVRPPSSPTACMHLPKEGLSGPSRGPWGCIRCRMWGGSVVFDSDAGEVQLGANNDPKA
jgi:hypothetical protein